AGAVAQYPDAKDLRLYYGRSLVGAKKLPDARVQYETLLKDFPNNADLLVTTGLICLQLADFHATEGHLSKALGLNYKDPEAIKYYLGQTFEEQKRDQEALDWYREVAGGEQFIAAHSRYAGILARQGKLAQAREYLRQVKTTSDAQRVELVRAEAQLLREKKAYQEAYDVLKTELDRQPDNVELLYDAAMMAERLNKIDVLETNLRRVIALKPDHAQAYNALGYTLADRNLRLQEAKQLLDKAHKLAPDDAFILDSVGWVYYRLGNLQDALEYLQRAYAQRQDPEIAAHLGEVLWKLGRSEEAEKVLRESMKLHAENDVLAETVKRLLP
ncbi:MAG: tetratricopeptide repeat protein, partial [Betaproteobacteria bacterium]|nr:tetratricopeptide repeat protein [Betaproteobacteria bacterium]